MLVTNRKGTAPEGSKLGLQKLMATHHNKNNNLVSIQTRSMLLIVVWIIFVHSAALAQDPLPMLGVRACSLWAVDDSTGEESCSQNALCTTFCPAGKFRWDRWASMYEDPGHPRFQAFYPDARIQPGNSPAPFMMHTVPICGDPDDLLTNGSDDPEQPSAWFCEDTDQDGLHYIAPLRCTDGTRPVYYYRPADDPDSTKFLVRISSGGPDCGSEPGCLNQYLEGTPHQQSIHSSIGSPSARDFPGGLFGDANVRSEFHLVSIDQCAGGRAIGESQLFETMSRFHHGRFITEAVLLDLFGSDSVIVGQSLPPSQIVFQTQSNGSWGAYMSIDGLHDFVDLLAGTDVDVRLNAHGMVLSSPEVEYAIFNRTGICEAGSLGEAALVCGHPDYTMNEGIVLAPHSLTLESACPLDENFPEKKCSPANRAGLDNGPAGGAGGNFFSTGTFETGLEWRNNETWNTSLDQSCLESPFHSNRLSPPAACLDPMHVLMFHVETPTFISAQKFDASVRSTELNTFTAGRDAWENEDFSLRVQMVADSLRRTSADGHKEPVLLPGHGVFIDHCGGKGSHWFDVDGKWESRIRDDASGAFFSQKSYFLEWLSVGIPYQPYCVSANPAEVCSDGLPLTDVEAILPGACNRP